jgi:hypothetical protein
MQSRPTWVRKKDIGSASFTWVTANVCWINRFAKSTEVYKCWHYANGTEAKSFHSRQEQRTFRTLIFFYLPPPPHLHYYPTASYTSQILCFISVDYKTILQRLCTVLFFFFNFTQESWFNCAAIPLHFHIVPVISEALILFVFLRYQSVSCVIGHLVTTALLFHYISTQSLPLPRHFFFPVDINSISCVVSHLVMTAST